MNVLVACEESQAVCKAFRERGHRAFSCDLQECSGGHPEWHIQGDVLPLLNGKCEFMTADGWYSIDKEWDLLIAHPPCTYLTVTGNAWFDIEKYGDKAKQRYKDRYQAIVFFMQMMLAKAPRIAVENPIGVMSTAYRKPDQVIQPYYFGDDARKATCLQLKGLPKLEPTKIVEPKIVSYVCKNGKRITVSADYGFGYNNGQKRRSKTYPGIAKAMAEQWGNF